MRYPGKTKKWKDPENPETYNSLKKIIFNKLEILNCNKELLLLKTFAFVYVAPLN